MINWTALFTSILILLMTCLNTGCENNHEEVNKNGEYKLMTLNPGHFHAALVQKKPIDRLNEIIHIYAPEGPDLDLHMGRY